MKVPALIEAWRKWNRSVAVAYEGIVNTIRAERNMRIHMAAAIVVLLVVLFALNSAAIWIRNKFRKRY